MGHRRVVEIVDDLTGCIIDDFVTVRWSVEDEVLEFDTTPTSAARFLELLSSYREVSRPAVGASSRRQPPRPASAKNPQGRAIRQWARGQGLAIASRGRIPRLVIDAYSHRDRLDRRLAGPRIPVPTGITPDRARETTQILG